MNEPEIKTFHAEEWNKHPQKVYEAAARDGRVRISHMHYRDKIFELHCREKRTKLPNL